MSQTPIWRRYLRLFGPNVAADVDDELQFHIDMKIGELEKEGWPREAAREEAMRLFGNVREISDECYRIGRRRLRAKQRSSFLEDLQRDVRMALRSLRRRPVFLVVATISLAIGIGANTAIFSLINAVFIKQYPYESPEELVRIYTSVPGRTEYGTTSFPNYRDIRDAGGAFEAVGAYKTMLTRMELQDESVRVMGEAVSQTMFPMLGLEPALGRAFLPEEDEVPGSHPVVMLGYGFWQRTFGGDPRILGTTVRLAGHAFTVVGVTPQEFRGLTGAGLTSDIFIPLAMFGVIEGSADDSGLEDRLNRRYLVIGRIADGLTSENASAGLEVLASQIQTANPEIEQEWVFTMLPIRDVALDPDFDRAVQPFAAVFMAAGGLILLLACANLSSFLLARGADRQKEIALRFALGAGRWSLVRQFLTEAMLMALLGGVSGALAGRGILSFFSRMPTPLPVPITLDLSMDRTVLLFTIGISAAAGLLFGLAPALRSSKPDVAPILRGGMAQTRPRRFGFRGGLVAFQVALSVVLLVGGGLFVRSLGAAHDADLGFSSREAGIVWTDLSVSGVPAAEQRGLREELTRRARALPGIEAATSASHIPFLFAASGGFYSIPGAEPPVQGKGHNVQREEVDPAFFETMGIPVFEGRTITADDLPGSLRVIVLNETAARKFWPGESPIGRQVYPIGSERSYEVVGVVGDTKVERLREPPKPLFYFPIAQSPDPDLVLVARGQPAPEEIAAMLRQMVRDVRPDLMILDSKTMQENVDVVLVPARMAAYLLGFFGVVALTLAAIGLYGVVNYSVSRRTREVGIRMSLGADAAAVTLMVLRGAMGVVAVGGVVGIAAALVLAKVIRHVLYGVGPWDLTTMIGVPFVLTLVAAVAALIPARRASRVNPVEALKYE